MLRLLYRTDQPPTSLVEQLKEAVSQIFLFHAPCTRAEDLGEGIGCYMNVVTSVFSSSVAINGCLRV
jgi:hypothetical protein